MRLSFSHAVVKLVEHKREWWSAYVVCEGKRNEQKILERLSMATCEWCADVPMLIT
jgi:hypothetical protein